MHPADALARLGGVATSGELLGLTTRGRLRGALERGEVARISRDAYALRTADLGVAAAARVSGVASHLSAAAWWRWPILDQPSRPQVIVPRHRTVRSRRGAEVRYRDLAPEEVRRPGVTEPLRTVLDCARDLPFESALRAICLEVPGLHVVPQLEVRLRGLTIHPDLADLDLRLMIEGDSFAFHSSAAMLLRDCERYTLAAVDGWRVARFGYTHVRQRDWVLETLTLLAQVSPPVVGWRA